VTARLTPFGLVFMPEIADRFPSIYDGLVRDEADPRDRDAFLMNREAVSVVHDLVPEGGMGDAVAHLAALVHHAYLFWREGGWTFTIDRATLNRLIRAPVERSPSGGRPDAYYLQLPRQLVWGRLGPDQPYQPLDGCFVSLGSDAGMRALGVFGLHADRMGFAVVEAEGEATVRPLTDERMDDHFAPHMDGGQKAGLYSVNNPAELLLLANRASELVAQKYPEVKMGTDREIQLR
jgi:hypothetical protein